MELITSTQSIFHLTGQDRHLTLLTRHQIPLILVIGSYAPCHELGRASSVAISGP